MIQGTFLATLARLFCVPPIRRDRGLNSRIVSCLSSASVIAVPYAPLAFVRLIHQCPLNSPHTGPVTRKVFPFDDVIMRVVIHSPTIQTYMNGNS